MIDRQRLAEIRAARKKWESGPLKAALEATGEREMFSEIPKKRLYTPEDLADYDYLSKSGFPGEYPYTRGIHPTMYRSRLWGMAEYAGFGMPEDTNRRWKFLLAQGQTGVSLATDLPTQLGYDPDHPLAEPEIGVVGVSCPSLREVEILFQDIPLDRTTIRGSINHPHIVLWSMYMAVAEKQGVPTHQMGGNVHWDCLNEYVGRGAYIFPPEGAMRLALDFLEFGLKNIPKLSYQVNAYTIRESGGSLVHEGAYAMAAGITFLEEAQKRGISVDDFAPRLSFNHAIHMNLFEEVAKFRALRRLWARIVNDRLKAKKPASLRYRFGPGTGGSTFTAQEPENNIARATLESLAAILGGATYLHTASYDEAHAIPSEQSVRIALKTQLILGYESGVGEVVDPLGGSYYVESLTDDIEKRVEDYLEEIEKRGGIIKAIKSGWFQGEIALAAHRKQREIEEGKRAIIGVNRFAADEKPAFKIHRPEPEVAREMVARVKELRRSRDQGEVKEALSRLKSAAKGSENLVPFVMDAVKAYATIGEICDIFRGVFGEYKGVNF
ncbi:MAG: methylmalonyl-CoA mutase [Deltaproteobacteria bacterium]|nr:methylmalonyl-CoA mutase [Deltaproteobacteria bacterium]MBW2138258.1 methylmalonyl-CoA mutase [Deltaproteobacteria bacterium]